jgi:hypothetical protein
VAAVEDSTVASACYIGFGKVAEPGYQKAATIGIPF